MTNDEVIKTEIVASEPKKRVKKPKSKGRKIFEWILFGVFGLFFAVVLAGNISGEIHKQENYGQPIRFGVGSFIILSSSMEPEIPKDSAIITYKEDVSKIYQNYLAGVKQDITFANVSSVSTSFEPDTEQYKSENGGYQIWANRIMTHRLIEIHEYPDVSYGQGRFIFVTAGINATTEDEAKQYQAFTEAQYLGVVKVTNTALGKVFNFIVSPVGLIIVLLVPAAYLIVTSSIDIFKAMKATEEENEAISSGDSSRLDAIKGEDRERLKKELLDEMIANKRKEKENEIKD